MALSDRLISYCKLGEAATPGARADSAGSNTLDDQGGAGVAQAVGVLGNAAGFGENDYLTAADGTVHNFSTSFTMSAWIRWNPADAEDRMITKWTSPAANQNYMLRWIGGATDRVQFITTRDADDIQIAVTAETFGDPTASGTIFRHVVFGHNADTTKLFININNTGTDLSTFGTIGSIHDGTGSVFALGANSDDVSTFQDDKLDGRIDELAIWNRALTDDEIALLYNSGAGNFYDNTIPNKFDNEGVVETNTLWLFT